MIIGAAVTHHDFKKSMQILLNNRLQFLATPTSTTTDAMDLKSFQALCNYYKANSLKDL